MRIVVHGQKAFGKDLLERLLERGEDVVAVCSAPTNPGEPEDPLVAFALEKKISLHQPASWKTQESLELMESFNKVSKPISDVIKEYKDKVLVEQTATELGGEVVDDDLKF